MPAIADDECHSHEDALAPNSIRWSLMDVTRCGQRGYMRPCQTQECDGLSASAFPMVSICEAGAEAVIVVDDEPDLRKHLAELVESFGYKAIECGSSAELQEHAPRFRSGCILLDVRLPGLDGLAIQDWLASSGTTLPVIFISGVRDIETVVQGMKGGAMEFLQKPIPEMALRRAVSAAVAKSRTLHCGKESARQVRGMIECLTPTELYVARMIAKGYPTKLIAAEMDRSENTVKIHRHRIFGKLKVNSTASVANLLSHADLLTSS